MRHSPGEEGYALVAAVASIGVFAAMALAVVSATRTAVDDADAEQAQLVAGAAADAGIAMALSGLLADHATDRWSIDGRVRRARFGAARLAIRVEDERGKVPVGRLDEAQATRLLEQVGMSGDALLIARDSLLDWTDDDDTVRPFGAEAGYYRAAAISPPNGFPGSIDELGAIRGFSPALVAALRPIVTTQVGFTLGFDARFADPRAIAVMDAGGAGGVAAIARTRELAGQRTAIALTEETIVGRPLTIAVDAALPGGGHAARQMVVELTGSAARRYAVRAYE